MKASTSPIKPAAVAHSRPVSTATTLVPEDEMYITAPREAHTTAGRSSSVLMMLRNSFSSEYNLSCYYQGVSARARSPGTGYLNM